MQVAPLGPGDGVGVGKKSTHLGLQKDRMTLGDVVIATEILASTLKSVEGRVDNLKMRQAEQTKGVATNLVNLEKHLNELLEIQIATISSRLKSVEHGVGKLEQSLRTEQNDLVHAVCELEDKTERERNRRITGVIMQAVLHLVLILFVRQVCLDAVETLYPPPPPDVNFVDGCGRMFLEMPGSSWWY